MARNRRRVEGEVTFSWVITRLILFVLLVGFLLGITFLKRRNLKMGDELSKLDRDLKLVCGKTANLEVQLAHYRTPRELESKMARWRIVMVRPSENQLRRFPEPESLTDQNRKPRVLVQNNSETLQASLARSP